jgi:hypothetical protein
MEERYQVYIRDLLYWLGRALVIVVLYPVHFFVVLLIECIQIKWGTFCILDTIIIVLIVPQWANSPTHYVFQESTLVS